MGTIRIPKKTKPVPKPKRKPGTRAGLTKAGIAAAAAKLIESVGPGGFSVRKLAKAIGVGPTSIHAHFKGGIGAVLDAVAAQAVAGTTRPFKPMEEAAAAAAAKAEAERAAEEKRKAENRKRSGPVPRPPSKEPDPKTQRNFTDPDSRVLLTKDGFIQGYNAQAAVDGAKQIIVAHGLTQSMSDCPQLVPLVDAVRANLGRKPREISADAGYSSEDNLLALATRKIHAYVATGRAKHSAETTRKVGGEMTQKMRQKLKRAGYRSRHRLRKQIVEPVFGQIKQARGFRQFLFRGLEAVQAEWALISTTHNITKLAKAV